MNNTIIKSFKYNETSLSQRKEIAKLLNSVWPDPDFETSTQPNSPITHRAELSAQSFCYCLDNVLIGYTAVVHTKVSHNGTKYSIAGLSCVATHPDHRKLGVGHKLVLAATQYIESNKDVDLGIFTCNPDLAGFYKKAGNWETKNDVTLVGSHDSKALSSTNLNVVVLMRVFSDKAKANVASFSQEPIYLSFPVGEFI